MSSPVGSSRPPLSMLLAVALVSAAVLGFEVALTRLFAVLLRYHFAFLVVSAALCGLGLGGYAAHWLRRRASGSHSSSLPRAPSQLSLPWLALLFAASIDVAVVLLLGVVFAHFPDVYWIAALVVLVPFTLAGAFLAEAFARFPQWSGRLYAWDLAGAAIAAPGVVVLLQWLGAINACLAIALLAALGALCLVRRTALEGATVEGSIEGLTAHGNAGARRAALVAVPLLALLWVANAGSRWLDIPAIPPRFDAAGLSLSNKGITQDLFTELGTPGHTSRIIDTRWNAFARTDVVADTETPDTYLVYTNGNVPTNMMRWDGDLGSAAAITRGFPLMDWVFASAPLGRTEYEKRETSKQQTSRQTTRGRVLSIGPGGGLDALMALHYGAQAFEGAEINPSIVGLMRDYREFNGGIYERPNVRVVTAEGRAYVREAAARGKRYALIFSALTKTATAGQGMALLESYIYTQDALADYWKALDGNGQAVIVTDQVPLLARLFATALTMLRERGLTEVEACRHIALIGVPDIMPGPYRYALVLQKSPMTDEQTYAMSDAALDRGLTAILLPGGRAARADYGPFDRVAGGAMRAEEFVAWWRDPRQPMPIDISPCSDNRPFVLDLNLSQPLIFKQLAGLIAALALGLAIAGWRAARRDRDAGTADVETEVEAAADSADASAPHGADSRPAGGAPLDRAVPSSPSAFISYFALLGVGFMLVEIPLAQKLILPLGYPTLALTVILFSILLGGGAGAWYSQRQDENGLGRRAAACALGVALVTTACALFLDGAHGALLALSLPLRCAVVGLLLLPLGFLLGTPFPAGLRSFARRHAANVPLIWGLNGVSSVAGSLGAAMIAKSWGLNVALLIGAACYVAAALLALLFDRAGQSSRVATLRAEPSAL